MARPIEVVSAEKFDSCLTADTTLYLGIVEMTMGKLNFIYHAAFGTKFQEVGIRDACSNCLLDVMKVSLPSVFIEPTYIKNGAIFTIELINSIVLPINC